MGTNSPDLALVGVGYWGKNLARNFHSLGVLHTLCDKSAEILASYTAHYAAVKKTDSFDAVLADASIGKVAIAAPAALHHRLAKAALLAGKDVYVEKPLCLNVEDANDLIALAKQNGRILMVGHLLQYHPCIMELQRLVGQGELGKVQYITSNRLNLGKIRQEENALWSFAPHDISAILSLVGGRLPQQVRCTGESYLTPSVADTTLTSLQFGYGVRAHIYVSWLNPFKEQKLTVVGSKGMAVFDDTKPWADKLVVYRDYLTWEGGKTPTPNKVQGVPQTLQESEPLQAECQHFVDCCAKRLSPRTDGAEGLRVLQVLRAAQVSLERNGEATSPTAVAKPAYFAHETAVVDTGARIGAGTKVWHFSHIMGGAEVGERCNFGQNVVVSPGVKIGNGVKVQNNVSIYTGTTIEDDVFLGPSCVLTNVTNPRSQVDRHCLYEKTTIRRGATIGANATIICGTTLGRYCFVAAGSVVTKDVPDYALVQGVPARQIGWMSRHGHLLRGSVGSQLTCPESGFRYIEVAPGVLKCQSIEEDQPLTAEQAHGTATYDEFKSASRIE